MDLSLRARGRGFVAPGHLLTRSPAHHPLDERQPAESHWADAHAGPGHQLTRSPAHRPLDERQPAESRWADAHAALAHLLTRSPAHHPLEISSGIGAGTLHFVAGENHLTGEQRGSGPGSTATGPCCLVGSPGPTVPRSAPCEVGGHALRNWRDSDAHRLLGRSRFSERSTAPSPRPSPLRGRGGARRLVQPPTLSSGSGSPPGSTLSGASGCTTQLRIACSSAPSAMKSRISCEL